MGQYSPKKLIRSISKSLLKRYFDERGLLADFDWEGYAEGEPLPIMTALDELDSAVRTAVERDFTVVTELATDGGSRLIYEEAAVWSRPLVPMLNNMANDFERAMLAMIEDRNLLNTALACHDIARFGESHWRRWNVGKRLQVADDQDGLAKALRKIFKDQGRGSHCHIDTLDRSDPDRFCCFAYPEDYPKTDLGYDEQNRFGRHARRTATEIIFVYRREDGILEMVGKGDQKQKERIAEAFCKTMLGLRALPDPRGKPPYDLSVLKRRDFAFKTDPEDNIANVDVRQLRFDLPGRGYRRLLLSVRPTPEVPDVLHTLIDEAINKSNFPLDQLLVSQAELSFKFHGQKKALIFHVTYPDRCNLKDHGNDAVAKKCLIKSGIARA